MSYILTDGGELYHKWGYTKGVKNGKRTARNATEEELQISKKAIEYINFKNSPPKDYNPTLKKTTKNGVPGYINDRGEFFSSRKPISITLQSWQSDIAFNDKKAAEALKKARANSSAIEKGKRAVSDLLEKIF